MTRVVAGLAVVLAGLAIGLLALAGPASAHASVSGSDPADGSRLASSPSTVTIRFDEPVGLNPGYLRVVDGAGRRVESGTVSHPGGDATAISVALKPGLGDSSYLASYRVISADSHPVAGTVRWVVGNGTLALGGAASGSASVNQVVSTGLASSHWLSFTGVGLVGGSWLIFTVWPAGRRRQPIRRLVWTGWTLAVVGAIGEFLLQGPYAAGSGPASIVKASLLDATLHVNAGQLLSLRLLLLGVLGAVLTVLFAADGDRRPSWAGEAAVIVGVGIVTTFAASGHAQSTNPRWLAVLVDALHLSSMIVWLGGLVLLLVAALSRSRVLVAVGPDSESADGPNSDSSDSSDGPDAFAGERSEDEQLAAGLPIFSRVAMGCVALLAVTGTIQAWWDVGVLDATFRTTYGWLVVIKVVLFLGFVGLGYFARRAVLAREGGRAMLARLRRTLLVEVVVGAVVLGVTAVLISQPPGRVALAAERAQPVHGQVTLSTGSQARVELSPGVHGNVEVAVSLAGGAKPTSVTATASLPSRSLGPIPVPLKASGPADYTASGVLLPSAGDWQITLTVQTSEFDSTTAVAQVRVN